MRTHCGVCDACGIIQIITIIIIIYKTRTLWHSLSTHVYYYSFIMDRMSVHLVTQYTLVSWGHCALSPVQGTWVHCTFASIIRSHRKNKIIKTKIRSTIQLPTQTHRQRLRCCRCWHTNLYKHRICALCALLMLNASPRVGLCCAVVRCGVRTVYRVDSAAYCILCWHAICCIYNIHIMVCAAVLGAISCCIFRFASIKCYHIAAQNPNVYTSHCEVGVCVCICVGLFAVLL